MVGLMRRSKPHERRRIPAAHSWIWWTYRSPPPHSLPPHASTAVVLLSVQSCSMRASRDVCIQSVDISPATRCGLCIPRCCCAVGVGSSRQKIYQVHRNSCQLPFRRRHRTKVHAVACVDLRWLRCRLGMNTTKFDVAAHSQCLRGKHPHA